MNKLRSIKFWVQRHTRGWDDSETWNIDHSLLIWINSRLKRYKQLTIFDLTAHIYEYKEEEYTLEQLIDMIIKTTDRLLEEKRYYFYKRTEEYDEMLEILNLIKYSLWW